VLEQVCIAALDCNKLCVAQKCIQELYKDFPKSLRVKKYEAMFLEAQEKFDDALELLEAIIKQDETNSGAKKRKIAILKAQSKNVEAIKELADYLKMCFQECHVDNSITSIF
jgi:predicted Zn-dependent protease